MSVGLAPATVDAVVTERFAGEIVPTLTDYIAIPALSPAFDPDWATTGAIAAATDLVEGWLAAHLAPFAGATVERIVLPGRTPVLLAEVPASSPSVPGTVLLYGHLDKQPEMTGWRDGLGPWTPVLDGERLYGRGGADDGYAAFAALCALEAVRAAGGAHARCVLLVEASEESGSPDLPAYFDHLRDRIGPVDLVVALDSGCADYERLWVTTSLRGNLTATLRVQVLTEGLHSGSASGVVPSSFRIARALLDRVEDVATGRILLPELHAPIPPDRLAEVRARDHGDLGAALPLAGGTRLVDDDPVELELNRTWRPTLSVTGAGGLPPVERAGNVLRPETALKLSFRLPPTVDATAAWAAIERTLTTDVPYGALVRVEHPDTAGGWNAPSFAPWLVDALASASTTAFGRAPGFLGEGGTIPFMGMLGEAFPAAQFVITGVLGPGSNAHGPNEFLHVGFARRLTAAVAHLLHAHATR
jgi:acetylornithine deacetylase/succinyl-diaminopimelate desuccinylase-like protein